MKVVNQMTFDDTTGLVVGGDCRIAFSDLVRLAIKRARAGVGASTSIEDRLVPAVGVLIEGIDKETFSSFFFLAYGVVFAPFLFIAFCNLSEPILFIPANMITKVTIKRSAKSDEFVKKREKREMSKKWSNIL